MTRVMVDMLAVFFEDVRGCQGRDDEGDELTDLNLPDEVLAPLAAMIFEVPGLGVNCV